MCSVGPLAACASVTQIEGAWEGTGAPVLGCVFGLHLYGSQGDGLCPAVRTKMYLGHRSLQDLGNVPGFPHWDNPSDNMAGVNLMRIISFLHWYGEVITLFLKSVLKWALGKADI